MKKTKNTLNKILIIPFLLVLITIIGCNKPKIKETAATRFCQKNNGIPKSAPITFKGEKTNWEYCEFNDKSVCPIWAFVNNGCQKGKCFLECRDKGTKDEGMYSSCSNLKVFNKCQN